MISRYRQRSVAWNATKDKKPATKQNDTSFCVRGLRSLSRREQRPARYGPASIEDANAETKPAGLRKKASLKLKVMSLKLIMKKKPKSPPLFLGEDLGGVKRYPF